MTLFDAKLSRLHTTLTVTKRLDDTSFEVPLHQDVIVRFEAKTSLFNAEAPAIGESAAAHVVADPSLPAEGWAPWRVVMLREAYDFAAPPEVRVPADSPAGRLLAATLGRYPSLCGADAFSAYRVFEQWFCTIGNGLDWRDGVLTDGRELPAPLSESERADVLAKQQQYAVMNWSRQLLANPPVKLYPLSAGYSLLFNTPGDVDDSFLVAAFQLCEYLLDRPVWQNFAYSPAELSGNDPSPKAAVWQGDDWRHIALADGMKYRTLVEQAYARLVLGVWRRRMGTLGFEDRNRRVDYSLPPRARRFAQS